MEKTADFYHRRASRWYAIGTVGAAAAGLLTLNPITLAIALWAGYMAYRSHRLAQA